MRIADEPRAADRAILLRQFNGNPPFDESTAEENNIQINVNDLEGPNLVAQARRQWNNAFLKPKQFFFCTPDSGPAHKRSKWAFTFSKHANAVLKKNRRMIGQIRSTGANTMMFGIGPVNWDDRRSVIPKPIPVGSLMIPSETEIDEFDNLMYFAIFREWNHAMLYDMTHGPKVDPGWNMPLVKSQFAYLADQLRKSPNSLAYQYMPERIEELIKQDKGYLGSDAVPTCDAWDFYFRDPDKGNGWYRRIILDWGTGEDLSSYHGKMPNSRNMVDNKATFLYTSGDRKYASSVGEILHCQFGDCSAYAPFKYHSIRSLAWMLWGVCDLQNRLHCKFNEGVFEQLMWFFQTAGNADLLRLKKANFEHMGLIPQGIRFLTANERYTPNPQLVQMAFTRNRQLMQDSTGPYTQSYERAEGTPPTATETMALVNASQSLASGILELAYSYEAFKYREMVRRLCIYRNTDPMAREFRAKCLKDGIPETMLDADRWNVESEQVLGGGSKTVQMATINYLNNIRRNLPAAGQRILDNLTIETVTDQPDLAQEMAPLGEEQSISSSAHDAQLATDRLLRGLPYSPPKDAILEEFVRVWLHDLTFEITKAYKSAGVPTMDQLYGLGNLRQHIEMFLKEMGRNPDERERLREYEDGLAQLTNHIKALLQRFGEAMKAQAKSGAGGNGGPDPKDMAKVQAMLIQANTKAKIAERSAAARTRQKEEQFQKAEVRKDQELAADIAREGARTRHEMMGNRLKSLMP